MCLDSNSNCLFAKIFFLMKNQALSNCRTEVCKALEMDEEQCELSMGMSGDFELAVWNSLLMLFKFVIFICSEGTSDKAQPKAIVQKKKTKNP